jgi:molecular chaperone GrpE
MMSEDKKDENPQPETTDAPSRDAEAQADAQVKSGQTEKSLYDQADEFLALGEENQDLKNRLLLLAADMENLRRRTEREKQDSAKYAISNFARDVLTIGDSLTRALATIPAEVREAADDTLKGLLEGVEMTEREMVNVLSRHGVKIDEPKGIKFDPNLHQAIFEVEDAELPAGTVTEVVQAGYVIGERVLRPAMVGVSKGGPKTKKPVVADEPEMEAKPEAAKEAPVNSDPADMGKKLDRSA